MIILMCNNNTNAICQGLGFMATGMELTSIMFSLFMVRLIADVCVICVEMSRQRIYKILDFKS